MGPGLRKATRPRVHSVKCVHLERLDANATRDWLDDASIVSEGGLHDGTRYYGSTYVTLPDAGGLDARALAARVDLDPHLRLRLLRVAHREATARAGHGLETMRAEIGIRATDRGVAITIEVEADVVRFVDPKIDPRIDPRTRG